MTLLRSGLVMLTLLQLGHLIVACGKTSRHDLTPAEAGESGGGAGESVAGSAAQAGESAAGTNALAPGAAGATDAIGGAPGSAVQAAGGEVTEPDAGVGGESGRSDSAGSGGRGGEAEEVPESVMIDIPAGTFLMGSDDSPGDPPGSPLREVSVDAFQLDQTEVTVAQYAACADSVCWGPTGTADWPSTMPRTDLPMTGITYQNHAATYCEWLGKRLPTEQEWEYAARGTDGRIYPWGNEEPELGTVSWPGSGYSELAPVGSFPFDQSPFGILDMGGNAQEMTLGCTETRCTTAAISVRGGAWNLKRYAWQSTLMDVDAIDDRVGFRCAR